MLFANRYRAAIPAFGPSVAVREDEMHRYVFVGCGADVIGSLGCAAPSIKSTPDMGYYVPSQVFAIVGAATCGPWRMAQRVYPRAGA
jgi:hypothetical protein